MIRSIAPPRVSMHLLGLAAALFSAASSSGAQVKAGVPQPQLVKPNVTGPLPDGVPSDPTSFRKQVASLHLASGHRHVRPRSGVCPKRCVIQVEITSLGKQIIVDATKGPRPGKPVARIRNRDSKNVEYVYQLLPYSQAEYFVWIDRMPSTDKPRLTLIEVPRGPRDSVKNVYQKAIDSCPPHRAYSDAKRRYPDADFKDCNERHAALELPRRDSDRPQMVFASALPERQAVRSEQDQYLLQLPLWIRCMSGCCY
jgi:hypothetical protein